MPGKNPVHAAVLPTREKDCGCNFLSLSIPGKIDQKGANEVISWAQPSVAAQAESVGHVCCEGNGLGTVHLRFYKARMSPLPWQNFWQRKVSPSPHLLQEWGKICKTGLAGLPSLQGTFPQEKDSKTNA